MTSTVEMHGQRYGRLTVVGRAWPRVNKVRKAYWQCVCDCGVTSMVLGASLRRGLTLSCGCLRSDNMKARGRKHG